MEKPQALSASCIFVSLSVLWLCAGYSYKCLVLFPADIQLPARGPGVIWTEGFMLPALQTLFVGLSCDS